MTIRRKADPEPTAPPVTIPPTAPPQATVAPTTPPQVTTAPQVTVAPTTPPQGTVAPTTAPPIANPPAPQPVTLYNTIGAPAHGEFLCSSNNANGSSWGIQTFAVPGNARFVSNITVGVGGRDGFTISLRRGGQELAGVRVGGGLDANIPVDVGRVAVTPGETLELWVGDGAGWTNNGTRSASRLFNVVATNADTAAGSYRTTNNCPGQAPGAQTLPGDISASITGWDS
jgi:hypothetical protein